MNLKRIKGLKYPDEYFVKFFFKNGLQNQYNLKYIEFGCGNGSNLALPYGMGGGNTVIGIDYDKDLIQDAQYNFQLEQVNGKYDFYSYDMVEYAKNTVDLQADVLLLPSVIYYISKNRFIEFLKNIMINNNIKNNIPFYIRVRSLKDFRYGYGSPTGINSVQIPENSITGEDGVCITFYSEIEIVDILEKYLNLRNYKVFCIDNQNEQNGEIILNSDIVIWGTVN